MRYFCQTFWPFGACKKCIEKSEWNLTEGWWPARMDRGLCRRVRVNRLYRYLPGSAFGKPGAFKPVKQHEIVGLNLRRCLDFSDGNGRLNFQVKRRRIGIVDATKECQRINAGVFKTAAQNFDLT